MLTVELLRPENAEAVIRMIGDAPPDYCRYFVGLPDNAETFAEMIRMAKRDGYWGMWKAPDQLAGIMMLRGLDAGFAAPAFGVYVRSSDSGKGLARLALCHALSHCRLHAIPEIMLSVDDANTRASQLYEKFGFEKTAEVTPNGQPIYRKRLDG